MHIEIPKAKELEQKVFNIHNAKELNSVALDIYQFQFHNNALYNEYCQAINRTPAEVKELDQVPFLPISFFKSHRVVSGSFEPEVVFSSSGTTGMTPGKHYVKSKQLYEKSFFTGFRRFYGEVNDYCILGLLPSYLEREGSSLVYMVDRLIKNCGHPLSGFYLDDYKKLADTLQLLEKEHQKTILIGVTYALLDFAKKYGGKKAHCILMETGGMKGRSKEITRMELYSQLCKSFEIDEVHAEYGMTELLSQAYAINGRFVTPPWMKVWVRDETDPLSILNPSNTPVSGAINIIDLANIYSCSFIASDDAGRLYPDGSFEVIGRLDNSDIRGCSLMVIE